MLSVLGDDIGQPTKSGMQGFLDIRTLATRDDETAALGLPQFL